MDPFQNCVDRKIGELLHLHCHWNIPYLLTASTKYNNDYKYVFGTYPDNDQDNQERAVNEAFTDDVIFNTWYDTTIYYYRGSLAGSIRQSWDGKKDNAFLVGMESERYCGEVSTHR